MAIFTHSYAGNGKAEFNPLSDYVSEYIVIKAKHSHARGSETEEYKSAISKGFIFCKHLSLHDHSMLLVKPSDEMTKRVNQIYGYNHESMIFNKCRDCFRVVWTGNNGDHRHYWTTSAVAGDLTIEDYNNWMLEIKGSKNEKL